MAQEVAAAAQPRDLNIPLVNLEPSRTPPSTTTSLNQNSSPVANVALPAVPNGVHGDPEALLAEINGDAHESAFPIRDPRVSGPHQTIEVDIIGVPAIYGDPEETWTPRVRYNQEALGAPPRRSQIGSSIMGMTPVFPAMPDRPRKASTHRSGRDRIEPAWITRGIRSEKALQKARVLLYDHGLPEEGHTLKQLATRLLHKIEDLRKKEKNRRPLFFVCHSTGGVIVKLALTEARSRRSSVLGDCYGVTFFATPHRGSSYLSMSAFSQRIKALLSLKGIMPRSIAKQLQLDYPLLREIDSNFKRLASDLHIWSFFETVDSDLSNPDLVESDRFPFHAPITSIKSALLNVRHEVVYPLLSDHAHCASFDSNNLQTKASYLAELARAVKQACELSKIKHVDLKLEDRVQVEVNGFYEESVLANEAEPPPIRIWSTNRSLRDFKKFGPARLLEDRLAENTIGPRNTQYLRRGTRAASIMPDRPKDTRVDTALPAFRDPFASRSLFSKPNSTRYGKKPPRAKNDESPGFPFSQSKPTPRSMALAMNTASEPTGARTSLSSVCSEESSIAPSVENALGIRTTPAIVEPLHDDGSAGNGASQTRRHSELISYEPSLLRPDALHRESRARRGSESSASPATKVTFSKPEVANQKLVWVHVPHNNPSWVKDVLEAISVEKGPNHYERLLSDEHWHSRHVRGRHAEHHACFVKPSCSFIGPEITSPVVTPNGSPKPKPIQMCLYLPFLHFDTYRSLVRRRNLVKRRIKQGRSRPVPQSVAKLESLELKVLWQYLGHDPPINCRRTLDQFGYPGLHDTRARDDDQMLYKMTKQRPSRPKDSLYEYKTEPKTDVEDPKQADSNDEEEEDAEDDVTEASESGNEEIDDDILDGNVLMVDQVWLWVVDNDTVVTFFPKREPLQTDGRLYQQADLRNSLFNEVNADLTSRCESSFDFAALVALHAATVLFERCSHPDLEIFRIFEEAISILTEKMTTSFKKFRARGFRDKETNYDGDAIRTGNIRAKYKLEGAIAEKQNRENTSALLELRDIEDELKTLETLFIAQEKAIDDMDKYYKNKELRNLTVNSGGFLHQAKSKLEEYREQAKRMIQSVQSTRDDFNKLLSMVQRQAQVDEVRLARFQADLASAQSRSVMIFTVFTVIFLPLTFFTGLFGMNTQEWGGGNFLTLKTIGAISLPTSFALITLALIVAWSVRMRKVFNRIAKISTKSLKASKKFITELWTRIHASTISNKDERKKSIEARRARRRAKKEAKKAASWLDEDFWEEHVLGRENNYRLPPQNRKSVGLMKRKMEGHDEMERMWGRRR